ncbi:MAG: hypothetical protein AAB871_00910 [Patescibacteria group bacterium]
MNPFASLGQLFQIVGILFSSGGWVVLFFVGLYLMWLLMVLYNQNKFLETIKWIHLAIDVPKENEQTFLAVEQIFAQLHSIHIKHTFGEKYFHGHVILWLSLEIVSFGGQIKYIVRLPQQYRNLLESAIYAQYPDAGITEVDDYAKNLPQYNPETSYYDVWGTEFVLKKEDAYPIRTYRAFEHQASQIIVDPLAGVLEGLSNIQPHELMVMQVIIRPTDDDWKEAGRELVKKLKGEKEEKKKKGAVGDIASSVLEGLTGIVTAATGEAGSVSPAIQEYEPPSKMMHLSPGEKDIIGAVELSLGKIGYRTKIRIVYIAPKEKFRKEAKAQIVGAFRQYDDTNLNGLKPDTKKTWTGIPFKFSKTLETPYIDFFVNRRKRRLVMFFKSRSFSKGRKGFILNIEELATIFHFPLITVKTPQISKTEIRKSDAPINLPVQY